MSAGGRPTKFKPEYCEMLIEHCTSGLFYTSFAGRPDVRVNIDTLYQWEKDYPEFSEAKKIAIAAYDYFLDDVGRRAMVGKLDGFNATAWVFTRKNRSGWRDKVEHSADKDSPMVFKLAYNLDELNESK